MYGEATVVLTPAAFMMTKGVLLSVTIGTIALAFGVQTTPVRNWTRSRVTNSWARRFATSGLGPVSSRRTSSSVTPFGSSFSCIFR